MRDRELQDHIIRYLTDAEMRSAAPEGIPLSEPEAIKAARFSHFLARRYYRDRLLRAFRYSGALAEETGSRAEEIVESPLFDEFLEGCILGSLVSARQMSEMANRYLSKAISPGPWWQDLLDYESAFFIQIATSEHSPKTLPPKKGLSSIVRGFAWRMPELLQALKEKKAITQEIRGPITLLFSRTHHGKIYVVELDQKAMAVFSAVNGSATIEQIASAAGVSQVETKDMLYTFREIGAIES